MKNPDGSSSTRKNWERLKTSKGGRLSARANKTSSAKIIIPAEYSLNIKTLAFVKKFRELQAQFETFDLIKALALDLLKLHNIFKKPHVAEVLREYDLQEASLVPNFQPPLDEWDLLGLCYQALVTEGQRNQLGIYYTPRAIACDLTHQIRLQTGIFLDPCCGSGSILLAVDTEDPLKLVGFDNDPIAVFIAKCNLLIRFKRKSFMPRIFCCNFLELSPHEQQTLLPAKVEAIATNPPWGAISVAQPDQSEHFAHESFALFYVKSCELLEPEGKLNFLFPQALLNVSSHANLRRFILQQCDLLELKTYGKMFSGVTTSYISLFALKKSPTSLSSSQFLYITESSSSLIDSKYFSLLPNYSFLPLTDQDATIIQKMQHVGRLSLNNSIFALGIVTGDNQHRLSKNPQAGLEPILSGKEVKAYLPLEPVYYITYDRSKLQQVAADEIYRAEEKLIYKFISTNLVFAYDNKQRLVLNSANILIPKVDSLSTFSVLALLNSTALQFYYHKTCNELKILKSNLCRLPLPCLEKAQDQHLITLVTRLLSGQTDVLPVLNSYIFELYQLSEAEQAYMLSCLSKQT